MSAVCGPGGPPPAGGPPEAPGLLGGLRPRLETAKGHRAGVGLPGKRGGTPWRCSGNWRPGPPRAGVSLRVNRWEVVFPASVAAQAWFVKYHPPNRVGVVRLETFGAGTVV